MVKQTNAAKEKKQTNKKKSLFPMIFTIIISVALIAVISLIILYFSGVNVFDQNTENASVSTVADERSMEHVNQQLESKDAEIEELQQTVRDLEEANQELEQEILLMEKNTPDPDVTEDGNAVQQEQDSLSTVSNAFEEMDSEQAALIMQNLDNQLAVSILESVSNEARGTILEEMDLTVAAELTELLVTDEN